MLPWLPMVHSRAWSGPLLPPNRPIRLTQCCAQFKSLGVKILYVLNLHDNEAFTFKWYGNTWNKTLYSQKIWIGYNIELAELVYISTMVVRIQNRLISIVTDPMSCIYFQWYNTTHCITAETCISFEHLTCLTQIWSKKKKNRTFKQS